MKQPASSEIALDQRPRVDILGVGITPLTRSELIGAIVAAAREQRQMTIAYANIHALNLAYELPWFRELLNRSNLVFCDGVGVKLGAHLLGAKLPERFTPPDWLPALAEQCCDANLALYFVGAQPGVAARAASNMQVRYPGLRVVGVDHGHFDHGQGSADTEAVLARIGTSGADILLVGFGMPRQEQWLWQNRERITAPVVLPVGAALDYLAGTVRRGPRWMTDNGLEWLARLVFEPRRLWRRYVYGNPLFFLRVLQQRLAQQNRKR